MISGDSMNLYTGRVLRVDLSSGRIVKETLNRDWAMDYLGGWGLAIRYLWAEVDPLIDPLSPDNALVIMTGPFAGTLAPMTSRLCLASKSPATGTIFQSNVGGAFGPELKFAGYDGLIITGRAPEPVYIKIEDDRVSLEGAKRFWGRGIFDTDEELRAAMGSPRAKSLAIGPAGENLVPYACVGSEAYRQFGRGGPGALFGSKRLKAIVCRGTGGVKVADMAAFLAKIDHYKETNLLTPPNLWAATDGTAIMMEVTNELGLHPTRNFSYGVNEDRTALNSDAVRAAKIADRACTSCPLACGKFTRLNGVEVEGPEYETLCLAGSNCQVNDLEQVIRFNRLCDDLGLDTVSTGAILALAMDLTERGRHDFGLRFGQAEDYLAVLPEIATLATARGRDLALGARELGRKYDSEELAAESKGLEFPAYDPRGNYGLGLAYATSERGACHLRAFPLSVADPFDLLALTRSVAEAQNDRAAKWSLGFCNFWGTLDALTMADLLSVGLGRRVDAERLRLAGERIWNLARLFNLKAGLTAADDYLPLKVMSQPLGNGPHRGRVLPEKQLKAALSAYYRARGWDKAGVPWPVKLEGLGLAPLWTKGPGGLC